jgi:uncharacterized membrane protein
MTESHSPPGSGPQPPDSGSDKSNLVNIVYILYLASLIFGVTGLIGVVIAYVNRRDEPEWLWSHYDFLIRTFWIGLLYVTISALLTLIVIGYLLIPLWYIWFIVRCVRGMKCLARGESHLDPKSWLFG